MEEQNYQDQLREALNRIEEIVTGFVTVYNEIAQREKELGIGVSNDKMTMQQWCQRAITRNEAIIKVFEAQNLFMRQFSEALQKSSSAESSAYNPSDLK